MVIKNLNNIYQTFYKRVKNYVKDDLYYVKAIENHQTYNPTSSFSFIFST